jgi:hypothetical protein
MTANEDKTDAELFQELPDVEQQRLLTEFVQEHLDPSEVDEGIGALIGTDHKPAVQKRLRDSWAEFLKSSNLYERTQ